MSRWEHGRPESIDSSAAGEIKPRHDDSVRCYHLVSSCFRIGFSHCKKQVPHNLRFNAEYVLDTAEALTPVVG